MKEAYCSYEIAKLLKEKGFNWECRTCYEHGELKTEVCRQYVDWNGRHEVWELMSAPTHQMAIKWLRDEKYISIVITDDETPLFYKYIIRQYNLTKLYKVEVFKLDSTPFVKYEDAVEAALKYVLENLI